MVRQAEPCDQLSMKPTFSIKVDPTKDFVHITMGGFFQPDDISQFAVEVRKAQRLLNCGPNQHVTLVDIQAMHIQSQDSVDVFARLLSNPSVAARKIAFVVTQSLARLQIKRAATGRDAGFFTEDYPAAEQWLFEAPSEG